MFEPPSPLLSLIIYIYIYICVCVCVCVGARARTRVHDWVQVIPYKILKNIILLNFFLFYANFDKSINRWITLR